MPSSRSLLRLVAILAVFSGCSWNGRIPPAPAPIGRLDSLQGTLAGADSVRIVLEPRSRLDTIKKLDFPRVLWGWLEMDSRAPAPIVVIVPLYYVMMTGRMLYLPAWWTRLVLKDSWGYLLPNARVRTDGGDTVAVPWLLLRHAQDSRHPSAEYSDVKEILWRSRPDACEHMTKWDRERDVVNRLWVDSEVRRLSDFTGVSTDSGVQVRLGRMLFNDVYPGGYGPSFGLGRHRFAGGVNRGDSLMAPWRPLEPVPLANPDSGILKPVMRSCPPPSEEKPPPGRKSLSPIVILKR